MDYKSMVEEAGVNYVGIQNYGEDIPSLVLFDAPSGSTLAVESDMCSVKKIKEILLDHEKECQK